MKNSRRAITLSRSMLLRSARANKFGSTKARTVLLQSTKRSAPLLRSSHSSSSSSSSSSSLPLLLGVATGLSLTSFYTLHADSSKTNWDDIKNEILALLDDPKYDDGSYGPVLVRLAWHASGTYSKADSSGGSAGGTMRFKHEASDGANAGLDVARNLLEPIKKKHPEISYGDLWTFAASVAIEKMGGPKIDWRPGRKDKDEKAQPPHGRLPDATKGQDHIRDVFYRMGFNDREIVALIGAHALGRCHPNRSGYDGPWTSAPTSFTNEFYVLLLEAKWKPRKWDGPLQYEDSSKTLMMTPADLAFVQDPEFKKYVELYAKDEDQWFKDFAAAWKKLIELGVSFDAPAEKKSLWKRIFG